MDSLSVSFYTLWISLSGWVFSLLPIKQQRWGNFWRGIPVFLFIRIQLTILRKKIKNLVFIQSNDFFPSAQAGLLLWSSATVAVDTDHLLVQLPPYNSVSSPGSSVLSNLGVFMIVWEKVSVCAVCLCVGCAAVCTVHVCGGLFLSCKAFSVTFVVWIDWIWKP